ncbi:MAG: hypothetical protein HC771_01860 [Synechococcales cyanobacterium CRU_2_2]|nr:hypothetical protein [Synechococcales cyanobacterium CRU_2_2]
MGYFVHHVLGIQEILQIAIRSSFFEATSQAPLLTRKYRLFLPSDWILGPFWACCALTSLIWLINDVFSCPPPSVALHYQDHSLGYGHSRQMGAASLISMVSLAAAVLTPERSTGDRHAALALRLGL